MREEKEVRMREAKRVGSQGEKVERTSWKEGKERGRWREGTKGGEGRD